MTIVILAAGKGVRLGKISQDMPKCLVEIEPGKPYLGLELAAMARYQHHRKIIVGGFAIDMLAEFLSKHPEGKNWNLVDNRDFNKGNLYSLAAARTAIGEDGFCLFNADHYYSSAHYETMLAGEKKTITAFCDRDRILVADDMKLVSSDHHLVCMAKDLTRYDAGYIGVTSVPKSCARDYWQAFDATANKLGNTANVEAVLNELANEKKGSVAVCDVSGSWWTEIDTEEDLERARKIISAHS